MFDCAMRIGLKAGFAWVIMTPRAVRSRQVRSTYLCELGGSASMAKADALDLGQRLRCIGRLLGGMPPRIHMKRQC